MNIPPLFAMTFLWPTAWALGALALPVIAFYLIRTRLRQRPASTLLFWDLLTKQVYNQSLWRLLRRWVSLLLQLLFVLLLVLAISQPMASWQSARPSSVILVLDASVTMTASQSGEGDTAQSRWNEAVRLASRRIAHLRLFDEAILIAAGETPQALTPWTRNKRTLERALRAAQPGETVSDIRAALPLARQLAGQRQQAHPPEIVLLSDAVWEPAPGPGLLANVLLERVGEGGAANAGLTLFAARRSFSAPGEYQLLARVEATEHFAAAQNGAKVELEIRRDGLLMDVQQIDLQPGQPWQKTWPGRAGNDVQFTAHLTGMARDDLAADNAAEARLPGVRPVTVEVVAPPHAFLDAALQSIPGVRMYRTWPAERLAVLPGSAAMTDPAKLYLFYQCLPPPHFRPQAMLLINPTADGFWGRYHGTHDAALVSETARDEPILRFVALENVRLDKVGDFTPAPGATPFIQYLEADAGGGGPLEKPLFFGQWKPGSPRWMVQSFGLEDSDLVFRTAFPILLANLVQSLQPAGDEPTKPLPGPAATRLKAADTTALLQKQDAPAVQSVEPKNAVAAWWSAVPLWWWALVFGLLWLLAEWGLFNRRITE